MRLTSETNRWQEAAIVLAIAAFLVLLYPFFSWWSQINSPWYLIYLLWALIIVLSLVLERRFSRRHDL